MRTSIVGSNVVLDIPLYQTLGAESKATWPKGLAIPAIQRFSYPIANRAKEASRLAEVDWVTQCNTHPTVHNETEEVGEWM
jgi:hypothetical protein